LSLAVSIRRPASSKPMSRSAQKGTSRSRVSDRQPRLSAVRAKSAYRLSKSLSYLFAIVGIRMGGLYLRVVKGEGLSLPMFRLMAVLAEQDRPLRLVELSAVTSAGTSTLSRLVAGMHKAGLVSRERPTADQRSLQVELTPAGRVLCERIMPVAAYYEDVATGDLSRKDTAALKVTLNSLYDNLDRLEAEVERDDAERLIQLKQERPIGSDPRGLGRAPNRCG